MRKSETARNETTDWQVPIADDDSGVLIFLALAFGLPWIVGVATIVRGVVWMVVHA